MVVQRFQQLTRSMAAMVATIAVAACVSSQETVDERLAAAGPEVRQIDDLVLVDCLLPGQIRQLGTRINYLAPRRRVKTTKSDCGIRGGEFVLFDRSNYKTALQVLLPQAQSGDVVAQSYVGEIYEKGLGLAAPDYAAAALWYRKAADAGHTPAQTNLGLLYERGLGVPEDKSTALNWYRKAIGVTEDRIIFESKLKAERAAFQREIALRNSVASSLRKQLKQARVANSTPAPAATPVLPKVELERASANLELDTESAVSQTERSIHAIWEVAKAEGVEKPEPTGTGKKKTQGGKLALSLPRKEQEVAALQSIKKTQGGKLELSLRQKREEYETLQAFVDSQQRLGSTL